METTFHRYEIEGWGVGELWVRDDRVVVHELIPGQPGASRASGPPKGGGTPPGDTLTRRRRRDGADFVPTLCARVREHLGGVLTRYDDIPIDLDGLTELQVAMAQALRTVPWGDVVTYGELASLAGRPRAARAAGSFCAEGRWSLIVPFHRVVAADGIGGYGADGVPLKRRLLAVEGVAL